MNSPQSLGALKRTGGAKKFRCHEFRELETTEFKFVLASIWKMENGNGNGKMENMENNLLQHHTKKMF